MGRVNSNLERELRFTARSSWALVGCGKGSAGRVQTMWDQVRSRLAAVGGGAARTMSGLARSALSYAQRMIDADRWRAARSWRDRIAAVSWPRASAMLVAMAVFGTSVWLVAQLHGVRAHPPRLPTETEMQAVQAAGDAMKADLSPALVAANRSVPSGTPQ